MNFYSGANLDIRSFDSFTPLQYAARNGKTEAIKVLLEAGNLTMTNTLLFFSSLKYSCSLTNTPINNLNFIQGPIATFEQAKDTQPASWLGCGALVPVTHC